MSSSGHDNGPAHGGTTETDKGASQVIDVTEHGHGAGAEAPHDTHGAEADHGEHGDHEEHGEHGEHGGHGGGHGHGKHHAPEDKPPSAPLWLLSFADMMTNLLCFFILLCAFSMKQQGLGLEDGLGSIKEQIIIPGNDGMLTGQTVPTQFNAGRVVYRGATPINTKTLVKENGGITDGNREALRRVLIDALTRPGRSLLPTPILFDADSTDLTAGHLTFLNILAEALASSRVRIRIDGYAFEEAGSVRGGWEVSERRARNVAEALTARGVSAKRVEWRGHGLLRMTDPERRQDPPIPQERMGRRSVLITLLD